MYRNVKVIAIVLAVVLMLGAFAGCASKEPAEDIPVPAQPTADTREIVDGYGRTVEIPTEINTILPFGTSTLRLVCYLGAHGMANCVDDSQQDPATINVSIPYKQVFASEFAQLPTVGKFSGGYITYNEEIIAADPDIIIVSWFDQEQIETLQEQTGIPVIGLVLGSGLFDDPTYNALTLLGDLLGKQERAEELIDYMKAAQNDLNSRTADIPENERKTVYSGAMSYYGQHGIQGTMAGYPAIAAINAINVADEAIDKAGPTGNFDADMESIQKWNPDVIFLDPFNISLVNDEYTSNPDFFSSLGAVKNGEVYAQVAFIRDGMNTELGLIDCYYAGKCVYPERFEDVDIALKAKEVFEMFIGEDLYSQYAPAGMAFDRITIGG